MKYYSTSHNSPDVTLQEAVVKGLAPDRGLYMPERIDPLPAEFFKRLPEMSLPEIGFEVARNLFGEDIDCETLKRIVDETLSFDIPVVEVEKDRYVLELFHGPTLAFKDVGARFMARVMAYFNAKEGSEKVNVLVATSGDTGGAVANGFLGVEGVHVYVLYPSGKVSKLQEMQFTTLGNNITALEVLGTFDDCQAMVKNAFMDADLNRHMKLTSANSINVARFLPQMFYYFHAVGQLMAKGVDPENLVVSVPSGNFGNITSALIGCRMGLPIKRFIAANNANDVFYYYLQTGEYDPRLSIPTIANAMDIGDPSNFARIMDLYGSDHAKVCEKISGVTYSDDQIAETMRTTLDRTGYLLDPHGAVAYRSIEECLEPGEVGLALDTAHPAKFKETVERITGKEVEIPEALAAFMKNRPRSVLMDSCFIGFKNYLMKQ